MSRFSRFAVLLAVAGLLITAAPAAAPAADEGPTATAAARCSVGDSQSYGTTYVIWIRKRNVSCDKARERVRAFHACREGKRGRCPNLGAWNCSENREGGVGSYDSVVRCTKGGKKVRHRYTQWT